MYAGKERTNDARPKSKKYDEVGKKDQRTTSAKRKQKEKDDGSLFVCVRIVGEKRKKAGRGEKENDAFGKGMREKETK